uniref:phospholipase A2 n=1 Tax=Meloidogyne hapla TaxID=6305 RepID=A0A1I8B5N7_MELHA
MIENKGAVETEVVDTAVIQNDVKDDPALIGTVVREGDSNEGTPVRTEDDGKPRFFSLVQIGVKVNDFASAAIASVKEKFLGEDYWIPSDPYEVVDIRSELLACHKIVYPPDGQIGTTALMVVQGSLKSDPSIALNHVVYTCAEENGKNRHLTIFRSFNAEEALDFCRRCDECRVLFNLLDQKKDIRRPVWDVTYMIKNHPLWRMVHIAILCNRIDIFSDDGIECIKKFGYSVDEGKYPLMLAIEKQQESIVRFLLKNGASPAARDPKGNNSLHYAALASASMLETLWHFESCKPLLNSKNNDGETPTRVAFQNFNPLCLKTLLSFGGELMLKATDKNPLFELMQSKGKTVEMIRVVLEASPGILNERDLATGNTCLHAALFKTSLMSVLHLKHSELDLNSKNKAGLTPLHQFVIAGDFGLTICIASYGADLNVPADCSKMSALHMAVSQRNLEITRLLLCLGADPNPVNSHGDTPRHMAAKLNEFELLKSLIICGAKRCPATKIGCVSGCVDNKALRAIKKPSSSVPLMLPDAKKSPTSLVEELENRTFSKEMLRYNKILDAEHNAIYNEMINVLNENNEDEDSTIINILSLDGGGIRGLVITQIMIEVERVMGESIFEYFDWVAGTSTGSLVAAGLACGQTLRELQRVYLRFKDLVFDNRRPHNTAVLETFIQDELGKDKLLIDLEWPRLLFTTTKADYFPVQLELMRNYTLPTSDEENLELGFKSSEKLYLWKALRRSSAAPTFFSAVDNKYIDGGIISNNPSLELLQEVQFWNSFNKLKNIPKSVRIGCLLSIGTGSIPSVKLEPAHLELAQNYITQPITSYNAVITIGQILIDQVSATEGAPVHRAGAWCISSRTPYFRLSAPLHKEIQMDAKGDEEIARMMWDCIEYMYIHQDYVEKFCTLLRKVGKSSKRKEFFTHSSNTSKPVTPVK